MRTRWFAEVALGAMSAVITATVAITACSSSAPSSLGESIYVYGADLSGNPIPRSGGLGMMGGQSCPQCHGADGRGGTVTMMMQRFDTPDIRWSTLSQPMQMGGEAEPAYDAATFARAVREGVGSDGDELESPMPRWQLSDPQMEALIAYLMTL
jgi:cytochrome c oxidase subunit 2